MLILTRKPGQSFVIAPEGLDPRTPIGELFANGPIEVHVAGVARGHVKLGIRADSRFFILRSELMNIISQAGQIFDRVGTAPGTCSRRTPGRR